jgi:hypothetical protein
MEDSASAPSQDCSGIFVDLKQPREGCLRFRTARDGCAQASPAKRGDDVYPGTVMPRPQASLMKQACGA